MYPLFMNLSYDYCMYWFLNRHGGVKNKIKLSDYKLNTRAYDLVFNMQSSSVIFT